jgi:hypothetical protein
MLQSTFFPYNTQQCDETSKASTTVAGEMVELENPIFSSIFLSILVQLE